MKMDVDLMRKILIKIADDDRREFPGRINIEDAEQLFVDYQIELLNEQGFLMGQSVYDDDAPEGGPIFLNNRLTMPGHEFLSSVRDPEIWKQTKAIAKKSGVGTLAAFVQIGVSLASAAVSNALGLTSA